MKSRNYPESNYKAMFFNGKTVRMKHDPKLPFLATPTTEIEDVAINDKCFANCSYCYTSALKTGRNFEDILQKALIVYGMKAPEERPFQIAIGGAGEPTLHPLFPQFLEDVHSYGIVPNYTTNGMHLNNENIKATMKFCGGVALSYHPHIRNVFDIAKRKLVSMKTSSGFKLNSHVILGDQQSFDDLRRMYEEDFDLFDYIVVLPYQAVGRGKQLTVESVWRHTFYWIESLPIEHQSKFAFGALFYEWLLKSDTKLKMSIYEPEMFSGYRLMDDSFETIRKSSYDLSVK